MSREKRTWEGQTLVLPVCTSGQLRGRTMRAELQLTWLQREDTL